MRKTSLVFLGAIAGAGLTLLATQPNTVVARSSAKAASLASSDTYRQLNLFGDVFERVRADYVEKPDDNKLVQSAINGSPGSIRIRATWIQVASATFRCRPGASSAALASRSPWRMGW